MEEAKGVLVLFRFLIGGCQTADGVKITWEFFLRMEIPHYLEILMLVTEAGLGI